MNEFNDIQEIWNQQLPQKPTSNSMAVIEKANTQMAAFKQKHIGTMIILSVMFIGLIVYLNVYIQTAPTVFVVGLSCMIISLMVRVSIELFSLIKFNKLDVLKSNQIFIQQLNQFYSFRKKVLYTATPIIIALYIIGFVMLLPTFKQVFSSIFFSYILASGFGFLSFITWLIFKQAKQEMKFLNSLKQIEF